MAHRADTFEQQLLQEFHTRLRKDAERELAEHEDALHLAADTALAEIVLGDLEEAGVLSEHDLCPHEDAEGRGRCRIIAYSLAEDSTRLELITAQFVAEDDGQYLGGPAVARLAGKAARFFGYAARGALDRFSDSVAALEAASRIKDELQRIEDVRVHIITNGLVRDRNIEAVEVEDRPIEFSVWDLERLYRASGEEVTRDRIEVDFKKLMGGPLPALEMKPPPREYQTFLLVVPGEVLSKLYDEFGPRLFEFNVRSFLQARGQVNKGIRDTLKTEPDRFLAYNNGLTATADEIEVGSLDGETVIHRLRGLQIVNGAQTTASIHRASKVDKIDVSRVAVSMKLTRVEPSKLGEFVPLIAKYANTQNPVQLADLSANNAFHIQIERLSEQVWAPGEESRWFYERARGAYEVARLRLGTTPSKRRLFDQECPKNRKFTKTDLAKVWMTWWGKPHIVSRGAQKNFSAFMAELPDRFEADWAPDEKFYRESVALVLLFKACQGAVRRAALQSYGANVVTYMLAKLRSQYEETIKLDAIWESQDVSAELKGLLLEWAPLIHQAIIVGAGSRNVTEFSKKEECAERIGNLALPLPTDPPPELAGEMSTSQAVPQTSKSVNDQLIERCMSLDGQQWAAIFAWAAGSPAVTEFDRKVAHTLLGYALSGWEHFPSDKQAPIGARVLDAAEQAGVLVMSSDS